MTREQIETFLTVVTYGNISAAADYLFVSQSTVSNRIQALEDEVGVPLLIRNKGHRNVELTTYGEAFIPIAGQWASLWKDTQNLKKLVQLQSLNIASVDAVNNYTFVSLFNQFVHRYPDIRLSVNTHHSGEIHGLVENHSMDIGFVFSQIRYPDIISKPVYRELMYLICHRDGPYHEGMSPEELDPTKEVFLRWGPDYQQWHDRYWSPDVHSAVTVNTGSMLPHYLHDPDRWGIVPMSVVRALRTDHHIVHYKLSDPPAPRICYQLTNRYPKTGKREVIQLFEKELERFIEENDDICRFESWML